MWLLADFFQQLSEEDRQGLLLTLFTWELPSAFLYQLKASAD